MRNTTLPHRRHRSSLLCLPVLLMAALLLCTACSSNNHMYRHPKSDCDCPTF